MSCIHRDSSYRGCDGKMYIHCSAKNEDIAIDECPCGYVFNEKEYCDNYETYQNKKS